MDKDTLTIFADQLYSNSDLIIVARKDGLIIGLIIGTVRDHMGLCYRIIVDEHNASNGVEKFLLKGLLNRFRMREIKRVGILKDDINISATELYLSLGFTQNDFIALAN